MPGRPSTGTAISVAHSRHSRCERCALSRSKPCAYGSSVDTGGEHQRRAREEQVPLADHPGALGQREQVRPLVELRRDVDEVAHRDTDAVVAVALEIGLHEVAELGHQHLEPQVERAREAGRALVHDLVAGIRERLRRLAQRARHRRRRRDAAQILRAVDHRDAQRPGGCRPFERRGHPPRIARIELRHGSEAQPHVAHRPRERPLHRHQLRRDRALGLARRVVRGHATERRPQSSQPRAIRGIADGARDVVAVRERRDARRHRRRRAARRSARRVPARPRAVGAAAELVDRVEAEAERRRVGAADDDRARSLPVRDDRAVLRRHHVGERRDAVHGGAADLSTFSLMVTGTPCSGPSASPRATAASAWSRLRQRLLGQDRPSRR